MIPVLIVPTIYHYDLLQRMLDSITVEVDKVIIIDNGNNLNNISCDAAKTIHIAKMPFNIGVAASWNLGIKMTPFAEWWLISNDDIIWSDKGLRHYCSSIKENSIVTSTLTSDNSFSGFAIHETVIQKVGLFDEYYYPACGEEVNYISRADSANVQFYIVQEAYSGDRCRSRSTLNEKYPRSTSLFMENLIHALINPGIHTGWQLDARRRSDPEVKLN